MGTAEELTITPAPQVAAGIEERCVTTLRMLAVDMVEAARSGHPGLPLGAAPIIWALWSRHLRYDPTDPSWPDRDRFVLSAGHGSALLYAALHLFGYALDLDDLRAFRHLGSRTPGHPERGHTPGVEMTTGPLGQGIAHAVGLALAERMAAARWNTEPTAPIVDHRTFVLCSDGDLMEGVSAEASSLAGHLRLGRLIVLYDDNRISIDGDTELAFSEDVGARYRSYGWQVVDVADGNDVDAIDAALAAAIADDERPALIRVRTTIGYGSPKAGTAAVHGAPLGPEAVAELRARFGWPADPFFVPVDVRRHVHSLRVARASEREQWRQRRASWAAAAPEASEDRTRRMLGRLPARVLDRLAPFEPALRLSTRAASGQVLKSVAAAIPELVGGSADLTESTCASLGEGAVAAGSFAGRQIHFGVREHAMAAICNGIALHGGFRVFGSTFLVFADYARPALRLAAMMRLPVIHVYTHDSIAVGEDGPTHQPVEQLASLRAIPGVAVLRPADANETAEAWRTALARRQGPTVLVLSRQALPVLPPLRPGWMASSGARLVAEGGAQPDVVIVATGSEVATALKASSDLLARGVAARVVSMPWRERFLELPPGERAALLPPGVPVMAVEAGVNLGWEQVTGAGGDVVSLDRFGCSGEGQAVQAALGFSVDAVAARAANLAGRARAAASNGRGRQAGDGVR